MNNNTNHHLYLTDKTDAILTKTIIQMNDVWTSYDSQNPILKGITLSIDRGTNYAIVGQSGSGKSTLLKLMNAMLLPSKGTIKVDYTTPNIRDKRFHTMLHRIGYIPQNLGLIKNLSVLENTLIGALPHIGTIRSLLKMFPEQDLEDAKNILETVGLEKKSSRKAYMLSGGEKRRVAIARALMQKPQILLADEIVSELDHFTAHEIMNLITDAQKQFDLTAIMVHHDINLALEYANRVAVIKEGEKILEIGVEGDQITDFQTGNFTQEEIMEMFPNNDSKK